MMPVVYVAGKFRGPTAWDIEQNVRKAEEFGLEVAKLGAAPLIPHSNTRFFHGMLTEQFWLDATLALLAKCDAVLMLPNWQQSSGATGERSEALRLGLPVFETTNDLSEWLYRCDGRRRA